MYSVSGYGKMMADAPRMDAYVSALGQAAKTGLVVVDLGSGPGLFALLACRMGARRVYAIEPDNIIDIVRQAAIANGYQERLVCIQEHSTRVTLPEQGDVIISDLRGVLPIFQHHIGSIIDARRRLLAPDGLLIPKRDTLWAAVVNAPETYAELVRPWCENNYEFDFRRAKTMALNNWRKGRVKSKDLLVEPQKWATLEYMTIESPNVRAEVRWVMTHAGTGHGLSIWFDTVLIEDVSLSNAPDSAELIYGQAFFPWAEPVDLKAGDNVIVNLAADLIGEDYIWRWNTKVLDRGKPGSVKADFKQSTLFGMPLTRAKLRQQSADYIPTLDPDGQIDLLILQQMNGSATTEQIAQKLLDLFPSHFTNLTDALSRVTELTVRYGNQPEKVY